MRIGRRVEDLHAGGGSRFAIREGCALLPTRDILIEMFGKNIFPRVGEVP
jgi:hypothetical protein